MTPQHLMEHLELTYKIASGEIQSFDIATPEKILEKVHNSLYNYNKFPKNSPYPTSKIGELEDLRYSDFLTAKQNFLEAHPESFKTQLVLMTLVVLSNSDNL